MRLRCTSRCHYCRVPLNPYIEVSGGFDLMKVITWCNLNPIDVSANDSWYRILGPNRTVRVCGGCHLLKYYKTNIKQLFKREVTGKHRLKEPFKRAVGADILQGWFGHLMRYNGEFDYEIEVPWNCPEIRLL